MNIGPWPTASEVNGGIRAAADDIECATCADHLRAAAIGQPGDPVQRVEAAVVVATARIAAHVANGHR